LRAIAYPFLKENAMLEQRKPKIGLLGIMHGLYDESQPEITRNQEQFARDVVRSLSPYADVDFPRAAKNRADIESIVEGFNHGGFDGILVVMLLYSPGFRLVRALEENRLPLMLANIQPLPSVTADWDWRRLTTNQGIHGAQDTASMMLQAGVDPTIVTDDWSGDDFREHFGDWARAVMTIASLKKMRIACFGRMKGMGDIVGDPVACAKPPMKQVFDGVWAYANPGYEAPVNLVDAQKEQQRIQESAATGKPITGAGHDP